MRGKYSKPRPLAEKRAEEGDHAHYVRVQTQAGQGRSAYFAERAKSMQGGSTSYRESNGRAPVTLHKLKFMDRKLIAGEMI